MRDMYDSKYFFTSLSCCQYTIIFIFQDSFGIIYTIYNLSHIVQINDSGFKKMHKPTFFS